MSQSEPTIYSCYCAAYALALTGGEVVADVTWPCELATAAAIGAAHGFDGRSSCRHDGLKTRGWVIAEVRRLTDDPDPEFAKAREEERQALRNASTAR